jgi:hypothetical protein
MISSIGTDELLHNISIQLFPSGSLDLSWNIISLSIKNIFILNEKCLNLSIEMQKNH